MLDTCGVFLDRKYIPLGLVDLVRVGRGGFGEQRESPRPRPSEEVRSRKTLLPHRSNINDSIYLISEREPRPTTYEEHTTSLLMLLSLPMSPNGTAALCEDG